MAKISREKFLFQKELRKAGDDLLRTIEEIVDSCIILCDSERLHNLAHIIDIQQGYEVIHRLREAGLSKDLRKLCDKAGRISVNEPKTQKEG